MTKKPMVAKPSTRGAMMEYVMAGSVLAMNTRRDIKDLPMIPRLPNLGYIDPHPCPDKVTKRLNIFLGDLSRNFPTIVNMARALMFSRSAAAIPRPCKIK